MDWDEELVVKPYYSSALSISFKPCDKVELDGYEVDENCIADKGQ